MSSRKTVRISPMRLSGRPGVLFQTPWSDHFLAQIRTVDKRNRWWNEHREGWWIAEEDAAVVRHYCLEEFGVAVIVDDEGHETTHDQRTGETLEQGDLLR